tara:strand:- start:4377 stop:4541 length:165 start_codon:yes stop_codon:yes gene_type:complete
MRTERKKDAFSAFENMDLKTAKESLPKKAVKLGAATVAGAFICVGFGLMVLVKR